MRKGHQVSAQVGGRHVFVTLDSLGYLRLPRYLVGYSGVILRDSALTPAVAVCLYPQEKEMRLIQRVPGAYLKKIFPPFATVAKTRRSIQLELHRGGDNTLISDYIPLNLETYCKYASGRSREKDEELGYDPRG